MRRMAHSAAGPRLPGRARRSMTMSAWRILVRAIELFIVVVLIGAGALAIRLSSGPVYLDAMRERVASSLHERLAGRYEIDIRRLYLMHDNWGVGLGFDGLQVNDPHGRTVVSAPQGQIGLDPLALLIGQVTVRRVQVDGLGVRLHVAKDGALSIAVSGDGSATPIMLQSASPSGIESTNMSALIRAAAEAMAGTNEVFDHLTLANGRFEIDNEATGRSIAYKDFNLVFDRSGDQATANVSAVGPAGRWTISARAQAGISPTIVLEAKDVSLADLESFNKKQPPVFVDGPIAFRLEARMAPDEKLQSLDGRFALGAGQVRLNNPDARAFLVDEGSGRIVWEEAQKRLRIEGLTILAGETQIRAQGWVSPPPTPADPWTIRMDSANTRFGPERAGLKPVALDAAVIQARIFPLESRFVLDEFSAKGPTVELHLAAAIEPAGPGVSLKLDLKVDPSVTPDIVRLWPQFINPDVRDWCSHNLHGGLIQGEMHATWSPEDLDAMDHKRAVARESVHGFFSSKDVGVDLLPGLPMMVSGESAGSFTGREFSLSAKSATMALTATRRILADDLIFTIPDTSPREIVDAEASAHLSGTADSLADLLNREPLRKQAGLTLDPATVHGQAEGNLTLALKLGKTAKPDDSGFNARGTLSNFTLDKIIGDDRLEQANIAFQADRTTLKMSGQGQVFGAPAKIDVSRTPHDEGFATLALTLDQAALAKRGLNFGWLSGSIPIKMKAPLTRTSAGVEMDLTPAGIDNPIPGVAKASGKPGKATFLAKPTLNGANLSDIAVDFGTVIIRGGAEIGPGGTISSAKLTQVRISPGDSLQAEILVADGVMKANVRGPALDARPFLKSLDSGSPDSGGPDLDLDLKVNSATGSNKQTINALDLNLSRRGSTYSALSARGRIGQGVLAGSVNPEGGLRLTSTDAGALARFADIYTRMEGGNLDLSVSFRGKSISGSATITNFVLRDEPSLRQLVAAAPARPDGRIDPTRVSFQNMTIAFTRTGGVLDIKDAVIYNQIMGLTAAGRINFADDDLDVSGTFIPAYTVNSMLNKIPLVGTILGGSNEGLIGISYRVRGAINSPNVSVNPLSAIAPGILRKILGVVDGTTVTGEGPDATSRRPSGRR